MSAIKKKKSRLKGSRTNEGADFSFIQNGLERSPMKKTLNRGLNDLEEEWPRQREQPMLSLFITKAGMNLTHFKKCKKVSVVGIKGANGEIWR